MYDEYAMRSSQKLLLLVFSHYVLKKVAALRYLIYLTIIVFK